MASSENRRSVALTSVSYLSATLILAAGIFGFTLLGQRKPPPKKAATTKRVPVVQVVTVRAAEKLDLRVDGEVDAYRETTVSAEVSGRVTFKSPSCETGMLVKGTDELVRLDPTDYDLEVERLVKQVAQADANLTELTQEVKNATASKVLAVKDVGLSDKEVQRLRGLSVDAATAAERDQADRSKLMAETTVLTLENQIALLRQKKMRLDIAKTLSEIQLRKARTDKKRTHINAKLSGVIVREHVQEGTYVQKGAPLFTVLDTSQVEVKCNLQVEDLYWVWDQRPENRMELLPESLTAVKSKEADQRPQRHRLFDIVPTAVTVEYRLAGRTGLRYLWGGQLVRYDGLGMDADTRTIPCRVVVADPHAMTLRRDNSDQPAAGKAGETNSSTAETSQISARSSGKSDENPPSIAESGPSRTAPPRALASGPGQLFRGMYVSVIVHTKPLSSLVLVPTSGLRQPNDQIWMISTEGEEPGFGRVRQAKNVHVVQRTKDDDGKTYWVVDVSQSDLKAGDQILVGDFRISKNDTRVEIAKGM